MREPPGGPRSGGEAMSEAKPVRWRPRRGHAQIFMSFQSPPTVTILYSVYLYTSTYLGGKDGRLGIFWAFPCFAGSAHSGFYPQLMLRFTCYKGTFSTFVFASQNRLFTLMASPPLRGPPCA
jgi:hypothetical protein